MENHMEQVAKMLGVELGEEFEVVFPNEPNHYTSAVLRENGIDLIKTNIIGPSPWNVYCLLGLLKGDFFIKHKPWKPKDDEYYYVVDADGSIEVEQWCVDNAIDMNYYKLGNCYRTREEAKANRDKWIAFYASDEVLEV